MRLVATLFLFIISFTFAQLNESPYSLNVEYNTLRTAAGREVSATVIEARVGVPIYLGDSATIAGSVSNERQLYGSGLGFSHLIDTQINVVGLFNVKEDWRVISLSSVRASHEEGVDMRDSVTFGGIHGAWYTGFEGLLIGGGFGYSTSIDDGGSFFPILLIDWNFAEDWTLTTRPTPGTRFGPGASLLYTPTEKFNVFLGALYLSEEFLLDNGEVYDYDIARAFITLQYRVNQNFSINSTVGTNIAGEIDAGSSAGKERLDPSAFIALNVSWDF